MKQFLIISKLNTGRQGCHLFPSLGSLVTNSMRDFFISTTILFLHLSVQLIKKEVT